MKDTEDLSDKIRCLLLNQYFAVLSSVQKDGSPYSNIIGFAVTDDIRQLVFVTPRSTRKFENITREPRVSLLVDNRSNRESDIHEAVAVTVIGSAREIDRDEDRYYASLYMKKHPHLESFLESDDSAFIVVSVDEYCYVSEFQRVFALKMKQGEKQQ